MPSQSKQTAGQSLKVTFSLRRPPDHSNYAECDECKQRRLAVEQLIRISGPRADINQKRQEQMAHIQAMVAERE
eukprot:5337247-Pleurochrysis_carterae.AAC.1